MCPQCKYDITFGDASLDRVPAWRIAPQLKVCTRTLLLSLLLVPSLFFIVVGVAIGSVSDIGTGVISFGLWNLIVGCIYFCYVSLKRAFLQDKVLRTASPQEALEAFWQELPGYEQSVSVLVGLVSYMGGIATICKALADTGIDKKVLLCFCRIVD